MQLLLLSLLTIPCPFFPLSLIDLSLLPKALLLHICYGLSLCRSHYAQRFLDYFVVVNLLQQIHFFVNMIFYRQDSLNVLLRNDGNRVSLLACSRSSSYPVDIVVRICWNILVDHQFDIWNIKTSRRNICSYQYPSSPGTEPV